LGGGHFCGLLAGTPTDARVLASGDWSLELAPTAPPGTDLDRALAIWARSDLQGRKYAWVLQSAMLGDYFLEAVREDGGDVRIYGYDPRWCDVDYDAAGMFVTSLVVKLAAFRTSALEVLETHRRTITPRSITIEELSADVPDGWELRGAGPHGLGVAPVVQLRFNEIAGLPEHGLWAGHGLEPQLQQLDGLIAQMRAILQRYAHPHMLTRGLRLDDPEIEQFGRILSIPANRGDMTYDVEYLEPQLAGLQPMLEAIRYLRDSMREQIPEYVFGAGANTSGRAYEMRMDALKRKMREVQGRYVRQIAHLTAMAYQMELGEPYDPSVELFRVRTPPILPKDEQASVQSVMTLRAANLITKKSAIEALQAIGIIDEDEDPMLYLAQLDADREAAPAPTPLQPTDQDDDQDDDQDLDGDDETE